MQRPDKVHPMDYETPFDRHDSTVWTGVGRVLMMGIALVLVLTLLGILAACVTGVQPGTPAGNAQTVYQAEADYEVALEAAVAYRNLPACSTGAAVCSDPSVVAKLQVVGHTADDALLAAQDAVSKGVANQQTISQAVTAVQGFLTLASSLKVK